MKVGIVTFHSGHNYGATLQCVGLYKTLRALGCRADVIDYKSPAIVEQPFWRGWRIRSRHPVRHMQRRWIQLRHGPATKARFASYMDLNLTFSRSCRSPEETLAVAAEYDALIAGSDQIWNLAYGNLVTPIYFLQFPAAYPGRRISYAACCGQRDQPRQEEAAIRDALLAFDALSVRNETTFDWVRRLTGLSPQITCDPTLLCDDYNLGAEPTPVSGEYILAYILGDPIRGGHAEAIRHIRNSVGDIPVVWICSSVHKPRTAYPEADVTLFSAGPAEWLRLIQHAAFVYTDSYHGALFSQKFRRPFLAYHTEDARASRLLDLSARYSLEDRVAGSVDEAVDRGGFGGTLKSDRSAELIERHKTTSMSFLRSALSHE